jgi:hypothetical protein
LRGLSAAAPPGVTESRIHLATIVTDGVSPARRDSVLGVLRAFARAKNAGTRYESRRREHGPWDMKQHYQNYRDWVLHEWVLNGLPETWPGQLEELYRRNPVFAIVSGLTDETWAPVEEFAATRRVPVVLPQAPLAASISPDGFYSMHYSEGVALEARSLARHLSNGTSGRVLQLSRCGSPGFVAASILAEATRGSATSASECLEDPASVDRVRLRTLLRRRPERLVLWLDGRDRPLIDAIAADEDSWRGISEVFVSSSLLGEDAIAAARSFKGKGSLLHPFVAPDAFDRHAARALTWFEANRLAPADRIAAVNAFFTATLAADALMMPGTLGSREYFVERLEHMAGRSPHRSAYQKIDFDATRHVGSAACQILRMP